VIDQFWGPAEFCPYPYEKMPDCINSWAFFYAGLPQLGRFGVAYRWDAKRQAIGKRSEVVIVLRADDVARYLHLG
jgi:hypothetical protein